jgi:hypothetical protein
VLDSSSKETDLRAFTPENEQALRQAARRFTPWRPRHHQPPGPIPETLSVACERATVREYTHLGNPAVQGQTANILPAVPVVVLPGAPAAQAVAHGPVDPFLPIGHNTRKTREFAIAHNVDPDSEFAEELWTRQLQAIRINAINQ